MSDLLTRRELNRATLQRQLLLERVRLPVVDAIEHLVGLQSQLPNIPYLALWSRLSGFQPPQLAELMEQRSAVRASLMRGTIHLVSTDDVLALRPRMQPVLQRMFNSTVWGKNLRSADLNSILAAGHEALSRQPMSRTELAATLGKQFAGLDAESMAFAVAYLVPLVQTTPRGVWGDSARPVLAPTEVWVSRPLTSGAGIETVVLRFLAAFGPATVHDLQAWCYLTRLREVVEALGGRLRRYRSYNSAELFDLADASLPDPETEAPVRFLPEYDNATIAYADRTRIVGDGSHKPLSGGPGGYSGTVLVDGFVRATWAMRRAASDQVVLEVQLSEHLSADERADVHGEGERLLSWLAPESATDIRIVC